MGGTSFLLNKKFHPGRLDNQKKVYIAEEKSKEKKQKEEEAAKEILKEREATYYENLGQIQSRDPRNSSLKFMYSAPNLGNKPVNKQTSALAAPPSSSSSNEDPAVAAFWKKVNEHKTKSESTVQSDNVIEEPTSSQPFDRSYARTHPMEHPLLKNAPIEGGYVKNMSTAHFKPFSEKIRNIQCSMCGEWGHRFGDRECRMRDYNPHDQARLRREDPMTYFQDKLPDDKQRIIISEAASTLKNGTSAQPEEQDDESDPETEFLATLTAREKKLLLRKLRVLQGEDVPPLSDDSDDSSTSSDSSSDSSDSEVQKKKRKKHKSDKSQHKSKKKHKDRD